MRSTSWPAIGLGLLLIGCDGGTKHLARLHLSGSAPFDLVPGVLALRYAENHDSAFSLIGDLVSGDLRRYVLVLLAAIATLVVLGFVVREWARLGALPRVGACLLLAGALGNLMERAVFGYVVDFVHLRFWPVFNVADVGISVGAALVVLFAPRTRAPGASPPPSTAPG